MLRHAASAIPPWQPRPNRRWSRRVGATCGPMDVHVHGHVHVHAHVMCMCTCMGMFMQGSPAPGRGLRRR